jgi:hypothetical protein
MKYGNQAGTNGYKLYDWHAHTKKFSWNVIFDEKVVLLDQ